MLGSQIHGTYTNAAEGDNHIGQYTATVYDLATGNRIWSKTWPIHSGSYQINPDLSGVAAFRTTGVDELRLVAVSKTTNGKSFQYQYFNILTGALSKQFTFSVNSP